MGNGQIGLNFALDDEEDVAQHTNDVDDLFIDCGDWCIGATTDFFITKRWDNRTKRKNGNPLTPHWEVVGNEPTLNQAMEFIGKRPGSTFSPVCRQLDDAMRIDLTNAIDRAVAKLAATGMEIDTMSGQEHPKRDAKFEKWFEIAIRNVKVARDQRCFIVSIVNDGILKDGSAAKHGAYEIQKKFTRTLGCALQLAANFVIRLHGRDVADCLAITKEIASTIEQETTRCLAGIKQKAWRQ